MTNTAKPPILVTGAGRRIGAHMAHRLLQHGHGVLAHYRSLTPEIDALQQAGAQTVSADFDSTESILQFADSVKKQHPRLRAIVHNASAFAPTHSEQKQAGEQFEAFFNIHMLTPFLLNRELAGLLSGTSNAPADIVFISDIYADDPAPEYDSYCATKAALQSLAISSAKRLAPTVKVNVIQPGPIDFADWQGDTQQQDVLDATLMGRTGGAEAIFKAVQSVLLNDFMTGAVIAVDGGRRWC